LNIFPAIDLYGGRAVRLLRGDYAQMTVYSDDPPAVARAFHGAGAEFLHVVDLEGARDGAAANFETIQEILRTSGLRVEIGGGIRSREVAEKYLTAGALRVILGTAAVADPDFLRDLLRAYGDKIAVGVDIKDGRVAVQGWTEVSDRPALGFCREMAALGVKTLICTDISKDGVLGGANLELYKTLAREVPLGIVASGGVSTLTDVRALAELGLYGAILGKALYTGDLDLAAAIGEAQ
jgi:phosphoribosylformimino-5-aminoimidazole carboxamide ribotide isomerase